MKVNEKVNQGLNREYQLTIAAGDIDSYIDDEVHKIAPSVRMAGFRPGKVPPNLIRKMHGARLSGDALNKIVDKSVHDLIEQNKLRPAMQPNVVLADGYKAGQDAELTVTLEVLPDITAPEISGLKLEKLHVRTDTADVDAALKRLADGMKQYKSSKKDKHAEEGDQIIVDYKGTINETLFDGGSADSAAIELGARRMIPGFEEQLIGVKAGEYRDITVTFPKDYMTKALAGKTAVFAVAVKDVKIPIGLSVDDSLAKALGMESLGKLREILESQLAQEHEGLTRTYMKRCLLDRLADDHDFDVPESMVAAEFEQIWQQMLQEIESEPDIEVARAELETERGDLRVIAERRVRLGLLLSEIGRTHDVQISTEEMRRLLSQEAQKYRSEDQTRFYEYMQQNPLAAAQLRAPLYEEKVVDFLFDKADLSERTVSRAEIEAAIEVGAVEEEKTTKTKSATSKKETSKKTPAKIEGDKAPAKSRSKSKAKAKAKSKAATQSPAKDAAIDKTKDPDQATATKAVKAKAPSEKIAPKKTDHATATKAVKAKSPAKTKVSKL